MYDAAGRFVREHYYRPGALGMFPENAASPLGYPVPPYPPSVMTFEHGGAYEYAMCASRGAPDPTRNHGQPNGQTDSSSCNAIAGNPINIGVGVKSQTEVDYEGTRLRFTRSYNSGAGTNTFTGLLGAGWQHSYARRLSVGSVTNPSYAEVVSAFRGDGRLVAYSASGPNWIKWPDVNDQLIEIRDTSGVRAGWKTFTATNDVETYDASGRLLSVVSSAGATTTLFYTDGTSSGDRGGVVEGASTPLPRNLLLRVTDSFGVSLSFGYNADSRLVRVTWPDGNSHRFAYASGNLTSVIYPDASGDRTRTYLYENPTFTSALTSIIDEKADRHSTYGYDQFGRATSTQLAASVNRYALTFNGDGTTAVTDPLGSARTYSFNNQFGLVRVATQSQPAGSGCGPSSSAITYDTQANVSSRHRLQQQQDLLCLQPESQSGDQARRRDWSAVRCVRPRCRHQRPAPA